MKLPGWLAVVLVTLLPMPAGAQSITLKDLTGAWKRTEAPSFTLFIQPGKPDSTFTTSEAYPGVYQYVNYLKGDTISLAKSESPAVCRGERMGYCGEPGYKITLKDQQLTLTSLGKTGAWYSGTYVRVDEQPPYFPARLVTY